ncbi:hypothetical protein H4219_004137 [Mycoemilia scoparia]|uniref:Extracellular metalloproteinase n=1 Tax=Mycoemilia scoparia TaxID=417184 RepID=A0A9W7ZYF6_9FUNG|nr:hypothetical protein H4219_004137 [Mycoemilia scoparia]
MGGRGSSHNRRGRRRTAAAKTTAMLVVGSIVCALLNAQPISAAASSSQPSSSFHGYHHSRGAIRTFGPSIPHKSHNIYHTHESVLNPIPNKHDDDDGGGVFEQPNRQTVFSPHHHNHRPSAATTNSRHKNVDGGVSSLAVAAVQDYVQSEWGLGPGDYRITDSYSSAHNGVTHVYIRRVVDGLDVANSVANFNIDSSHRILSVGSTVKPKSSSSSSRAGGNPAADAAANTNSFDARGGSGWPDSLRKYWQSLQQNNNRAHSMGGSSRASSSYVTNGRADDHESFLLYRRSHGGFSNNNNKYITATDALEVLALHLGHDISVDELSSVSAAADMLDKGIHGVPAFELTNVPSTFALDGKVEAEPGYIQLGNDDNDGDYDDDNDDSGNGDGLVPVWGLVVEQEDNWWHAHIDARTGKIHSLVDWVNHATYRVFPWGVNDPFEGNRSLVLNPADKQASPSGWHTDPSSPRLKNSSSNSDRKAARALRYSTVGNNVWAQENHAGGWDWVDNHRPTGGPGLNFDFSLDFSKNPKSYVDASITQLFYTNNMMHDLFYHYGFNETAGNFQDHNFNRGGREGDAVIANSQDGSGYNNANFATPPDGRRPKMRMYIWNGQQPYRDGDLEAGIVIHEYSHGISTRLTGGPMNSGCLPWGESGGMGEGWGDFFATLIRLKNYDTHDSVYTMGEYAAGEGIRKFPYSTNMKTNPSTYDFLNRIGYWEVHSQGEVWAEILYEVMWKLIDKHGFTANLFGHDLRYGNTLALQLVVDSLKLQPCYPTFTDSRDAILLADRILTGGQNQCEIWAAFSKRGLGKDAKLEGGDSPWGGGHRVASFSAPEVCAQK